MQWCAGKYSATRSPVVGVGGGGRTEIPDGLYLPISRCKYSHYSGSQDSMLMAIGYNILFLKIFIWLGRVLVAARGFFLASCGILHGSTQTLVCAARAQ